MTIVRIVLGWLLMAGGAALVFLSYATILYRWRTRKSSSAAPFIGGIFGALGVWMADPFHHGHYWWAFLIVDPLIFVFVGLLVKRSMAEP